MLILLIIILILLSPFISVASSMQSRQSHYVGGKSRRPQRTYVYPGNRIPVELIAKRLPGWRMLPTSTRHANLVIATGMGLYDKKTYKIKADLKCQGIATEMTDKAKFHANMAKYAPDLIAKTMIVDNNTTITNGDVWILRGNWGFGGSAVKIVTNTDELQEAYRGLLDQPGRGRGTVLASEYIMRPALYNVGAEGDPHLRKFHFRVLFACIVTSDGRRGAYMFKQGVIIPAKSDYVMSDWRDATIHDTHGKDNPNSTLLQNGVSNIIGADVDYLHVIHDALSRAVTPLLKTFAPYPESKSFYELYGADIMVREDGRAVILEINDHPGLGWATTQARFEQFVHDLVDFIFDNCICKVWPDLCTSQQINNTMVISEYA